MNRNLLLILALAAIGVGLGLWAGRTDQPVKTEETADPGALVKIQLPATLSASAQIGKQLFEANCAACHGTNAVGQMSLAPPLVHIIYEPGHHGDESFQSAVAFGVRGHHWPFGNMPPVEGVTREDVARIIDYVRELQRANGIK